MQERVIRFRPRTILVLLLIVVGVGILLALLWIARHVLVWIFIALFLALALNPAVDWVQGRGVRSRGLATASVYVVSIGVVVAIGALFVPTLVNQVNDFANKVPDYLH